MLNYHFPLQKVPIPQWIIVQTTNYIFIVLPNKFFSSKTKVFRNFTISFCFGPHQEFASWTLLIQYMRVKKHCFDVPGWRLYKSVSFFWFCEILVFFFFFSLQTDKKGPGWKALPFPPETWNSGLSPTTLINLPPFYLLFFHQVTITPVLTFQLFRGGKYYPSKKN